MTRDVLELTPDGKVRVVEKKRSKYGNRIVKYAGMTFHSHSELKRWLDLEIEQRNGEIAHLSRQNRWPLFVKGELVGTYVDDYDYVLTGKRPGDVVGTFVVEDRKGGKATQTKEFKLKRKLMKGCHGIDIRLTGKGVK